MNQDISANAKKTDWLPLALSILLTLLYFAYSFKSKGFYQQDEANHYLSMLRFWYDPAAIMGNWAKPGYKILYVLTALGGQKLVILQNCAFAAFSCFFAYKSAERLGAKNPWVAFILLATQPLWIALAFRNYSEFPAAFLLILAFWFYSGNKMWLAAIISGLICTIRQEFYPIAAVFGIWLLYRKFWLPALSIAIFPLLQNLAGYLLYDDPIYLYNQILGTSSTLKDAYERMGFEHYFLTSAVVFGPLALTFFVAYFVQNDSNRLTKFSLKILIAPLSPLVILLALRIFHIEENQIAWTITKVLVSIFPTLEGHSASLIYKYLEAFFSTFILTYYIVFLAINLFNKKDKHPGLLFATIGFFLINCLLNMKVIHIGPATGGNLRYMCIISPLVAVIGALALNGLGEYPGRTLMLLVLIPFLALVGVYLNFEHNFLRLLEDKPDSLPLTGAIFATAFIFLPFSSRIQTISLAGICSFMALLSVKAIKLSPEDKVCQQVADWYRQNSAEFSGKPLYNTHIMFYYFSRKVEKQFNPEPSPISDTATMEKAPVGSLVLWDSHYGYRPNYKRGVPYEYFAQSGKYETMQILEAEDRSFAYVLMRKTRQ